jgi:hypothetical protein
MTAPAADPAFEHAETFDVTLFVYEDPASRERFLLPTEEDLRRHEVSAVNFAEDAATLEASALPADKARAPFVRAAAFENRELARRLRDKREELLPFAQSTTYKLGKPTLGRLMQAKRKAKTVEPQSGRVAFDADVLADELFPTSVVGLSPEEALALPAYVAEVLWARLFAALRPAEERILFLSPSSPTTST